MATEVIIDANTGERTEVEYPDPTPPTPAELDAIADALADRVLTQQKDVTRAIGETLAEVIWRVSNGTVPQNITEAQARTWVRDTFRDKYRALL